MKGLWYTELNYTDSAFLFFWNLLIATAVAESLGQIIFRSSSWTFFCLLNLSAALLIWFLSDVFGSLLTVWYALLSLSRVWIFWLYSDLFMITVTLPLSAGRITIELSLCNSSSAVSSDFGRVWFCLWLVRSPVKCCLMAFFVSSSASIWKIVDLRAAVKLIGLASVRLKPISRCKTEVCLSVSVYDDKLCTNVFLLFQFSKVSKISVLRLSVSIFFRRAFRVAECISRLSILKCSFDSLAWQCSWCSLIF